MNPSEIKKEIEELKGKQNLEEPLQELLNRTRVIELQGQLKGCEETLAEVEKLIEKQIGYLKEIIEIEKSKFNDENTLNQFYARINELKEFKQKLKELGK